MLRFNPASSFVVLKRFKGKESTCGTLNITEPVLANFNGRLRAGCNGLLGPYARQSSVSKYRAWAHL
jgi:hypothetical protein